MKTYIVLWICLSLPVLVWTQSCDRVERIDIYTQAQLDSVVSVYQECPVLPNKAFRIIDVEDMDYSVLDVFEEVNIVLIGTNSMRRSLNILPRLQRGGVAIHGFPYLERLEGFDRLEHVSGYYDVISVEQCPDLTYINAFNALQDAQLHLIGLPKLRFWHGFASLRELQYLEFENGSKVDFSLPLGLRKLGELLINNDVRSLDFGRLDTLTSIFFYENNSLYDLDAMAGISYSPDGWSSGKRLLKIYRNKNLSDCAIPLVCEMLEDYNVKLAISNNAPGCNSKAEVKAACAAREECSPPSGRIVLDSQADVDSLGSRYRSCDRIYGEVHIIGDWDLRPLDHFRHFGGLRITGLSGDRLEGLDSLESVKWLRVEENPYLKKITGLSGLRYASSSLTMYRNPLLQSLDFPSLSDVGELEISVYGGRDLRGLDSLRHAFGGVTIQNCGNLETLSGLDSLRDVSKIFNLHNNVVLHDISVLGDRDLSGVDELTITVNPSLSICHHEGICHLLEESTRFDYINIQGNAEGCNSESEVLMSCGLIDGTTPVEEKVSQIYPNPTTGLLHIVTEASYDGLVIYDYGGRELYRFGALDIVDLSEYLAPGMYWLQLQKDGEVIDSHTFIKVR